VVAVAGAVAAERDGGRSMPGRKVPRKGLADATISADARCELRPVTIQIGNSELLGELIEHFARSGFATRAVGATEVVVDLPDAPDHEQGRREVGAHLLVWAVLHPEDPGDIVA
jgi:hypothetical protein